MADHDTSGPIAPDESDEIAQPARVSADNDSGIGVQSQFSTASLNASIYEYEEEYGRSYHAFRRGKYVMPNDDREQERMDIHYHAVRLVFDNKHYFAPLEKPTCILDVGTGTGIWVSLLDRISLKRFHILTNIFGRLWT